MTREGRTAGETVIGILHPGDLGAAMGAVLVRSGSTVCVAPGARGEPTRARAEQLGATRLASVGEVVDRATLLVSVVPPSAALALAEEIRAAVEAGASPPLVVDVNSVTPAVQARIAGLLAEAGIDCVDGGLQGTASRIGERCSLFLSGPRADEAASALAPLGRIRVLGDRIGAASEQKMLLSALSKGVAMLALEILLAACRVDALDETVEALRYHYPGLWETVSRTLPTYGAHSGRRAEEVAEIAAFMQEKGTRVPMTAAAAETIRDVAGLSKLDTENHTFVPHMVESMCATPVLAQPNAVPGEPE